MKRYLFFFLMLAVLLPLSVNGQDFQNSTFKFDPRKLIYGADFGFVISQDYWAVAGSPQIGYKLTDRFHVGAGLGYRYGKSKEQYYSFANVNDEGIEWQSFAYGYTEKSVSLNLFAHYYPWKKLVFSVKPEVMHTWYKQKLGEENYSANKFVPAVTVGGGIHLKPVILQLNYELIHSKYSPYSDNLFFSIGFLF